MKNIILKKVNGTFLISDITPELVEEIKNSSDKHLCWLDCKNASPLTCPKVEDIKKKSINMYDFIKDGAQIINEKGKLTDFLVYSCTNYEKSENKEPTTKQKQRLRKLKAALRMVEFNADSVEEAYVIQNDLLKRGAIKNPQGYMPEDEVIQKIKSKNPKHK